jgi:hypothetical protein
MLPSQALKLHWELARVVSEEPTVMWFPADWAKGRIFTAQSSGKANAERVPTPLNTVPANSAIFIVPLQARAATEWKPKNQKRCWYSTGSPPPVGLKKTVLKLRSINRIVIAPASTGRESKSRKAVIRTAHTKSGIVCSVIP